MQRLHCMRNNKLMHINNSSNQRRSTHTLTCISTPHHPARKSLSDSEPQQVVERRGVPLLGEEPKQLLHREIRRKLLQYKQQALA